MPTDSFTPQYTPGDYQRFGQLPMDQQRRLGQELLKQKYWNNLGVDYRPGYEHMDDSRTRGDRARAANEEGKPDIIDLQNKQLKMERDLAGPHLNMAPDMTPQPISAMSQALQGPQDPAMSALFSQPAPKLQQMAGDVLPFPGSGPGPGTMWDLQSALQQARGPGSNISLMPQPSAQGTLNIIRQHDLMDPSKWQR